MPGFLAIALGSCAALAGGVTAFGVGARLRHGRSRDAAAEPAARDATGLAQAGAVGLLWTALAADALLMPTLGPGGRLALSLALWFVGARLSGGAEGERSHIGAALRLTAAPLLALNAGSAISPEALGLVPADGLSWLFAGLASAPATLVGGVTGAVVGWRAWRQLSPGDGFAVLGLPGPAEAAAPALPRPATEAFCPAPALAIAAAAPSGPKDSLAFGSANLYTLPEPVEFDEPLLLSRVESFDALAELVEVGDGLPALKAWIAEGRGLEEATGKQQTLLHIAAYFGREREVIELLRAGADLMAKDDRDRTPFMLAAQEGHVACLARFFPVFNFGIDTPGPNGKTALHLASERGQAEVVKALLRQHGADPRILDARGHTALDLARAAGEAGEACALLLMAEAEREPRPAPMLAITPMATV